MGRSSRSLAVSARLAIQAAITANSCSFGCVSCAGSSMGVHAAVRHATLPSPLVDRSARRGVGRAAIKGRPVDWTEAVQQQAADGPGRGAAAQEVLVVAEADAVAEAGAELVAFQLPVLDSGANSGQGRQQPAARRAHPLRRLALASPGVHTTGSGFIAFLVRRARGATRQPLMGDDNRSPGGAGSAPSWTRHRLGVPRRGVVTDLPVAHRDDRDATGGLARRHLARAADAGRGVLGYYPRTRDRCRRHAGVSEYEASDGDG